MECEEAIDNISVEKWTDVSDDEIEQVNIAIGLYDRLSNDQKSAVVNYSQLERAEQCIRVSNVFAVIENIGDNIKLESEEKIRVAREDFNLLSDQERQMVENYQSLVNAEARLKELKVSTIIDKMRIKEDEVKGITWLEHRQQPYYANSRTYALPYIGCKNDDYWLRWKILYTGDDWCFWTNLTFAVDGQNYYHSYDYFEVTRDNGSGAVWEYVDISVKEAERILLEKIANSEKTIIRFEGEGHYYDLTVSAKDKQAITDILTAYDLFTNNL